MDNHQSKLSYLAVAGFLLVMLCGGFLGGILFDRQVLNEFIPPSNVSSNSDAYFKLMAQAWNAIQSNYVDRSAVQPQKLTYGAISGMVDALGDTGHSRFLSPEMVKEDNNQTKGEFDGIGIEIESVNGQTVIVSPLDGSPAQKAGLKAGEIITKVNGNDISGLPVDQIVQQILGPAGTQVQLTILNPTTRNTREVTLTRARITIHNVTWQQVPGTSVADIRIAAFSQGVSADLEKVLAQVQQAKMTGIILDLRNDPGGLLDEAVGVSSQFLKSGDVLLEKDAKGNITPVPVRSQGPVTNLPMVVLVNQGTASAAEIVAGSLEVAHRAALVGETTFGTGTVLNQFALSDGSALLLATEEWLTPSGQTIWHKGITPQTVVQLPEGTNMLTPDALKALNMSQLQSSGDSQFLRALNLLNQASNFRGG
jgi:carboxyl-terminal processing protease